MEILCTSEAVLSASSPYKYTYGLSLEFALPLTARFVCVSVSAPVDKCHSYTPSLVGTTDETISSNTSRPSPVLLSEMSFNAEIILSRSSVSVVGVAGDTAVA